MSDPIFNDFGTRGNMPDIRQMYRVGLVVAQDPLHCMVRVNYPDRDNMVSPWLPLMQKSTAGAQDFWLPRIGEQVHVLHSADGDSQGVVLGASYTSGNPTTYDARVASTSNKPPAKGPAPANGGPSTRSPSSPNARHVVYDDGTFFEHNPDNSTTTANTQGPFQLATTGYVHVYSGATIDVTAGSTIKIVGGGTIMITAPLIIANGVSIDANGNVVIPGTLQVTGNVTFKAGGSIQTHLTNLDGQGNGS
jgi:phage baseplate assembly protein gpV